MLFQYRYHLLLTIFLPILTLLPPPARSQCDLTVELSATVNHDLQLMRENNKVLVRFDVMVRVSPGETRRLEAGDSMTFQPSYWLWVLEKDSYLLRQPLDYELLTLYVLRLRTEHMTLVLQEQTPGCLNVLPGDMAVVKVGEALLTQVISPGMPSMTNDGELLCRSAYTFTHFFFAGSPRQDGVGYRCCTEDDETLELTCNSSQSSGWWITYVVSLGIVVFVLVIVLFKVIPLCLNSGSAAAVQGVTDDVLKLAKVEQIEGVLKSIDVTDRVYIPSKQKDQLMTLGIPRRVQKAVAFLVRFFAVLAIFGLFYGYVGFSVYFYANLESIDRLRNHEEIFVNVIGHLGWLYADAMSPELMTYAKVELGYTLSIPVIGLLLYLNAMHIPKKKKKKPKTKNKNGKFDKENGNINENDKELANTDDGISANLSDESSIPVSRSKKGGDPLGITDTIVPIENEEPLTTEPENIEPDPFDTQESSKHSKKSDSTNEGNGPALNESKLSKANEDDDINGKEDSKMKHEDEEEEEEQNETINDPWLRRLVLTSEKIQDILGDFYWGPLSTAVTVFLSLLIGIWTLIIGLPYLTYSAFVLFFAVWVNLDGLVLYVLPAGLVVTYFISAFKPLDNFSIEAKAKLLKAYQDIDPAIVESHEGSSSIPRDEFDEFYIPRARKKILEIVVKLLLSFGLLLFLYAILLNQQWPMFSFDLDDTGIVGANIAVLFPILAVYITVNTELTQSERTLLGLDAKHFVRQKRKQRLLAKQKGGKGKEDESGEGNILPFFVRDRLNLEGLRLDNLVNLGGLLNSDSREAQKKEVSKEDLTNGKEQPLEKAHNEKENKQGASEATKESEEKPRNDE